MKQNLKKELNEMYHAVPPLPDSRRLDELLDRVQRKTLELPKESSLVWFVRSQIPFISRRILAAQFLLLCLYGFYTNVILHDREGFLLLVPAAPLAVLIGTAEISRSFRCNMAELELPSRFSLPRILLARLVITAVLDILSLTGMLMLTAIHDQTAVSGYGYEGALVTELASGMYNNNMAELMSGMDNMTELAPGMKTGMETGAAFGLLILYALVPALLAAAGSLFLINRCRSANVQYYVSAYCTGLSAFGAVSVKTWPQWYSQTAAAVWLAVLITAAVCVAAELYKMLHHCTQKMEFRMEV